MSNKDNFQILTERDHILKRPNMYIGSTSLEKQEGFLLGEWKEYEIVPGLMKIFDEILDNSVDEYIRTEGEYANLIEVTVSNNALTGPQITVRDNGRGIPLDKIEDEYRPVLSWTRARAGTNFDDEDRTTMGMNGVGAFCTNVFSTWFEGSTCDGKKILTMTSTDNASNYEVNVKNKKGQSFTQVSFTPDMEKFGVQYLMDDMMTSIEDRLMHLSVCFPGLTFKFNDSKIKFENLNQIAKKYSEKTVVFSNDNMDLIFAPGQDEEFRFVSYVNGLNLKSGGTHIDYIVNTLANSLRPMIKRKYKIDVLPAQIRQHLTLVSYIRGLQNLKFNSQTKEKLTNTVGEISGYLGFEPEKVAKKIMNTPEILDPMIQAILMKKEQQERAAAAREQKKQKKTRVLGHIAAQSKNSEEKTLFITEGQSAIGQLINVRDPKTTGGYPLKGKILNVRGMSPLEIVKNKEISELMSILNLTIDKKADNLNYGKIAILTDADVDGGQISCLLVNLFALWPELFKEGRVAVVQTPLVIATKGKERKIYYTLDEWKNAKLGKGWSIEYYKGLGSLTEELYDDVINNPRLVDIKLGDSPDKVLEMAFGGDTQARKEWLMAA